MTADDVALRLRGITKRFGSHTAVDDVSLEVPRGCIQGFIGPNGAGKTTTIRMIMSIFYPDAGSIEVLGNPDAEAIKDRLGYLPEEKGLYKKMRAGEIVAYFGRLKGLDRRTAKLRAETLLHEYGLGDWIHQKCEALSKGMGQKVQLLATLVHEPELVILDEPFSGLDPINMDLMRDTILRMRTAGRTVIFSTHVMAQAEEICDRVFMIKDGQKVLDGTLAEIRAGSDRGIQLDYEGPPGSLADLPGVARVADRGNSAEIFLHDGADPQAVLRTLVGRVKVRRFDVREPSLHEIYKRVVGGELR